VFNAYIPRARLTMQKQTVSLKLDYCYLICFFTQERLRLAGAEGVGNILILFYILTFLIIIFDFKGNTLTFFHNT